MRLAAWLCSRIIFICRDRGDFSGGLLPVLPDSRPVRGEPAWRGSDNRCYGKCKNLGCDPNSCGPPKGAAFGGANGTRTHDQ